MNLNVLSWFAFALWLCVVLTGCFYMAMGMEIRRKGAAVKWWSFSFRLKTRIATCKDVIESYRRVKRERDELPFFLWAMAAFGIGVLVIPIVAAVVLLVS